MGIIPQFNVSKNKGSNKRTICFLLIVLYAIVIGYFAPQPLRWYYYIIPAFLFVAGIRFSVSSKQEDDRNKI